MKAFYNQPINDGHYVTGSGWDGEFDSHEAWFMERLATVPGADASDAAVITFGEAWHDYWQWTGFRFVGPQDIKLFADFWRCCWSGFSDASEDASNAWGRDGVPERLGIHGVRFKK